MSFNNSSLIALHFAPSIILSNCGALADIENSF